MRVIIIQDVPTLGRKNDVKDVSDGYARNFLFPKNLAKPATENALKALAGQKAREERESSEEYQRYKSLAEKLKSLTLNFKVKMGKKGQKTGGLLAGSLPAETSKASTIRKRSQAVSEEGNRAFGSVTAVKIRDALKKQGFEVEKEWVLLEDSIKTTGERKVKIKLPHDLLGEIKIIIEKE